MYLYLFIGKKGKKTKGQTLALTEFLGGAPTVPIKSTNWADDVEDEHGKYVKIIFYILVIIFLIKIY